MTPDLESIGRAFQIHGQFLEAFPISSGHINDSFAAVYDQAGTPVRYVHQRINHHVFKDPEAVMANIEKVTHHTREKLYEAGHHDVTRRVLTIVPALDGRSFHLDETGNYWRTYFRIEGARTHSVANSTTLAFEAAKAFGTFQRLLADLDGRDLHETIPDFHHTRRRFESFVAAVDKDVDNRAAGVRDEIAFYEGHASMADVVLDKMAREEIPVRVTHNDTKINNVMIDDATSEGICVIDLDTVMPGSSLYDFGDLVRTSTSPAAEDEQDLSKVMLQLPMFEALVQGYQAGAGDLLTAAERELLVFSGKLLTYEVGLRFLTDHLEGDRYFKIHRENHNADRCRTQMRLIESIEWQSDDLREVIEEAGKSPVPMPRRRAGEKRVSRAG